MQEVITLDTGGAGCRGKAMVRKKGRMPRKGEEAVNRRGSREEEGERVPQRVGGGLPF